ncbi:alcohol dehydrogenase catalytic domain-containing protein [Pseudohalocynthiibacter aestuariivivens]|nr:alcohol dehydrogenase catalytic domain-containing protein [Pseudohalocynthiibacter aestuariivivens]QIE44256.1 alcohol dehydrogenase catalytic domain-containing protein [Pseudohalocynthiibacter aestuariivivens]
MTNTPPRMMTAAISDGPGAPLVLRQVATPQPRPGEVLVKLESCGVCHSDLHLRDGQENLPDDYYPVIFGHEGIGRVVQIGENTPDAPEIGTRVGLPWLYDTCLACKPCRSGWETFCTSQTARGVQRDGAFAEYALSPTAFTIPIPEAIDPIKGAPLLCAGLTAWSALARAETGPRDNVLIIGAGGLGQYAVMIAKARGARVFVVDKDPAKLESAQALGADHVIPAGPDAGTAVKAAGGADVTINFAPSPAVWNTVRDAVNPMSAVVAVAMVHEPVDLSMMWLIDGGHRVLGSSVGTRQDMIEFLDFAARHPLPIDVQTLPLSGVDAALDQLKRGEVTGRLCIDFTL